MTSEVRERESIGGETTLDVNYSDSTGTEYVATSRTFLQNVKFMRDVVVSDYRERIARGEIINNPCKYTVTSVLTEAAGSVRFDYNTSSFWFQYDGPITSFYAGIDEPSYVVTSGFNNPNAEANAKLAAIANIDSTPYAFGEDAYELRETLRFLRNPITSLVDLTSAFKRAVQQKMRGKSGLTLAQAVASVWLSYRFALSPLLRSAHDVIQLATTKDRVPPKRRNARGFDSDDASGSGTEIGSSPTGFDVVWTKSATRKWHASILYEMTNPVNNIQWRAGLRFKDVPATVWAVMPYSFMVDRVVDISRSVSAFTNLLDPSIKILSASVVSRTEWESTHRVSQFRRDKYSATGSGKEVKNTAFVYVRYPWAPSYSDAVPSLDVKGLVSDATKIVDLCTLIVANLRIR